MRTPLMLVVVLGSWSCGGLSAPNFDGLGFSAAVRVNGEDTRETWCEADNIYVEHTDCPVGDSVAVPFRHAVVSCGAHRNVVKITAFSETGSLEGRYHADDGEARDPRLELWVFTEEFSETIPDQEFGRLSVDGDRLEGVASAVGGYDEEVEVHARFRVRLPPASCEGWAD